MSNIYTYEIIKAAYLAPNKWQAWYLTGHVLKAVHTFSVVPIIAAGHGISGDHAEITSVSHYQDFYKGHRIIFKVQNLSNKWLMYYVYMSVAPL